MRVGESQLLLLNPLCWASVPPLPPTAASFPPNGFFGTSPLYSIRCPVPFPRSQPPASSFHKEDFHICTQPRKAHAHTDGRRGCSSRGPPPPRSRFLPVFSQTFVNNILFASLAAYSNTLTQDGRTWLWLNNKVLTNIYFFTTKVGLAVFTGIGEALPRWAEARVSQRVRWGSRKLLQWLCWTGRGRGPAPMLAFCLQEVSDRNTVFLRACTLPYLSSWNCPPIHRRTK